MIYVIENTIGKIAQRVDTLDSYAEHYERDGYTVVVRDEAVDITTIYAVDGEFALIPEKPSEFHVWDWPTHTWIQDRELAEKSVRSKRAALLNSTVDKINAVRWAAMEDAKKAEWDTYRTALLDVPDQSGFPLSVAWPSAPQ